MSSANIERVTGQRFTQNFLNIAENGTENGQSNAVVILFDDAFNVLPHPGEGSGVNTYPQYPKVDPDTLNFSIRMVSPVSFSDLGTPPYNPFIIVDRDRGMEVHLPNHPPTQLADMELLGTGQDNSDPALDKYYVSDIYLPWAINIPESFDYPIEKQDITKAYLRFNDWATSQGMNYADWYTNKSGYRDNQKIY
jgi:LruC domain-containing protein